jgi:predicted ATP-grasp superfamily ATP-dependent carboligase
VNNLPGERILVPHATNRGALAVIRSLGRHGCHILASAPDRYGLGCASRYCHKRLTHPDPESNPAGFLAALLKDVEKHQISVVLPTADIPTNVLLAHQDQLPGGTHLVAPARELVELAHDKAELGRLAERLGVPWPRTILLQDRTSIEEAVDRLGLPLVVKPRFSVFESGGRWVKTSVRLVSSARDLEPLVASREHDSKIEFLLQEKVPGEGRGVFVLARQGEIRAVFAHRRLREKPPWGGESTLCEATDPEPSLVEYAERLLRELKWSGVAMLEFKWDPESRRAWLMEINGRFWGSTQLAVAAGIEFPWLLYAQEVQQVDALPGPRRDARMWWLRGDLAHFVARLRTGGLREVPPILRDFGRTRQGMPLDTDTFKVADPLPFVVEWAGPLLRAVTQGH